MCHGRACASDCLDDFSRFILILAKTYILLSSRVFAFALLMHASFRAFLTIVLTGDVAVPSSPISNEFL